MRAYVNCTNCVARMLKNTERYFFFINNDPNHLIQFLVIFKKFHPFQKAYFSRFKFHVLSHKFKIQRILLAEVHLLNNNI